MTILLRWIAYILISFCLGSCAVVPEPSTSAERQARVQQDLQTLYSRQSTLKSPLTVYEAMARALKYNLDIRLKHFEQVLARRETSIANMQMLPDLAASAGFISRNNLNAAGSFNLQTQVANFGSSTSQDKNRDVMDLEFGFNLLDFGVSYVTAKQRANQFLIAQERKRKMAQNVMRDVRYAYWRSESAQRLMRRLLPLSKDIEMALSHSQKIQREQIKNAISQLKYRESLFVMLRQMLTLQRNIKQAKTELTALMNVRPETRFNVEEHRNKPAPLPPGFKLDLRRLEHYALDHRPELREEDYHARITYQEILKERLRLLPGVELNSGLSYDSNSFLLNRNWADVSLLVTWNLMQVINRPAAIAAAKTNRDIATTRRLALSMAVITQVDIAYYRYHQAEKEIRISRNLFETTRDIYRQAKRLFSAGKIHKLDLIQLEANLVLERLRYDLDYAEWQNAAGQLITAIGDDYLIAFDTRQPVKTIAQQIKHAMLGKGRKHG